MIATNVCIVDDCDLDFEMGAMAIRQVAPNVSIVRATSCSDAMPTILKHRPPFVLLDLHFPDCSGIDVLQELAMLQRRSERDRIAIVVFSTSTNPIDRQSALEAGADDFRSKPTNPHEFMQEVRALAQTWLS